MLLIALCGITARAHAFGFAPPLAPRAHRPPSRARPPPGAPGGAHVALGAKLHQRARRAGRPSVVLHQQPPGTKGEGEGGGAAPGTGAKESWWESAVLTWKEVNEPKFDDDQCYAALAVKYRLEIIEATKECMVSPEKEVRQWAEQERSTALLELLPNVEERSMGLIWMYWMVRWRRVWSSPRLRASLPSIAGAFNVAFIAIFLRLSLPRLLAMQSMGDLGDFSKELGLPGREELASYLAYTEGFDFPTKFAAFTAIFAVEKVLMIGELIPFGVILPTISPALFGSVLAGTLVTATSSTLASSVNFWLGRNFLQDRVRAFALPGQPPIGESGWFRAIYRRFDSSNFPVNPQGTLLERLPEGFKSMLLMRLAPLLPIPVDGHWYVAGTTQVRYSEFFAAHFLGTLKVAILDAYLGSLLLQAVTDNTALEVSTKVLVIVETLGLILVSVVVTNVATNVFTQLLAEEGVSMENMVGLGDDSTNSAVAGVVGVSAADEVWLAVDAREREAIQREEDAGRLMPGRGRPYKGRKMRGG
eukprot:Tamp_14087.p1 GENE.Tamp_14087~~Tamp_14087.p1  ORF type:complete len:547 (+),score=93.16 Tamp_14087:48-1643(+)